MMIVVEGPDAAGKSTLARYLAEALELPMIISEGPPKHPSEMGERLKRYSQLPANIIFDRHPCVSEMIYAPALGRACGVSARAVKEFYDKKPFFIYCDPARGHQVHVVKEHESREHLEGIASNRDKILAAYRDWAFEHATVLYRIGDDMSSYVHHVIDFCQDIADFHQRFDLVYMGKPRHLDQDFRDFRIRFMAEELCEYAGVSEMTKKLIQSALQTQRTVPPLEDQFDALIDLVYVALGTSHMHGFPFHEGWARVQAANMRKARAIHSDESKRGSLFDVVKPPGWKPPNLKGLLK